MFNIQALSWKIGGSSLLQVGMSLIQVFILAWEREDLKFSEGEEKEKGKPFYLFAISSEQFFAQNLTIKTTFTSETN